MTQYQADAIAAIVTAPGRGAVGIVRMSGQALSGVVRDICGQPLTARHATHLPFLDAFGAPIDSGLAIFFPGPHSYTGEDVLELQGHGGSVVMQLLLQRCLQAGAEIRMRLAQPGEFTQRAFLNDKLDLAQAEAIADLIDAGTEAAVRSANRSLSGAFSGEIKTLLAALTDLRMLVEASLDFPEEETDILRSADVRGRLTGLEFALRQVRQKATQGALLRDGIRIVIAGQPNVGKSSLLNALAGAELAIVSPIAGTTRDKIEQTIQIEGVPVHVIDTAGLRESNDDIERIGVARAWEEIGVADAIVFLHDLSMLHASGEADQKPNQYQLFLEADAKIAQGLAARLRANVPVIHVWNKLDAVEPHFRTAPTGVVHLSAKTGEGLAALRTALLGIAGWQPASEGVYMARERHLQALQRVVGHIEEASLHLNDKSPPLDLLAEELRLAQNALGEITGVFGADELLGVIFSRFCIGK